MDNRKQFEEPLCQIVRISAEDVITTSGSITNQWDTDEFAFNQ